MPTYLGPADNLMLEEDGKVYHPGDSVPISAERARHMSHPNQGGHRFEDAAAARRSARAASRTAPKPPGEPEETDETDAPDETAEPEPAEPEAAPSS